MKIAATGADAAFVRPLDADHRRYLLLDHGVGALVANAVINGVIAWLVFPAGSPIPFWGDRSVAGDTLATGFLLPFITSVVVHRIVRAQVTRGRVRALPPDTLALPSWSHSSTRVGAIVGAAGVALVALPVVLALDATGVDSLSHPAFIAFKATFAAIFGLVVTPPLAWCALVRASHDARAAVIESGAPR